MTSSFTVQDILDDARGMHSALDKFRAPGVPALRLLSRRQKRIAQKIVQVKPSMLEVPFEVPLDTYDFEAGEKIPQNLYLEPDKVVELDGETGPFHLVPTTTYRAHTWPSGYIRGERLYLAGDASDWSKIDKVILSHVPIPAKLTAGDDNFELPDDAEDLLVAELTLFLLQRLPRKDRPDLGPYKDDRDEAQRDFLSAIGNTKVAQASRIRRVQ